MRVVVQRVRRAAVNVGEGAVAQIGPGLVIFVGVGKEDGEDEIGWMAEKIAHLRVFEDVEGRMDRSLLEIGGQALVVSQFTLYGGPKGEASRFHGCGRIGRGGTDLPTVCPGSARTRGAGPVGGLWGTDAGPDRK